MIVSLSKLLIGIHICLNKKSGWAIVVRRNRLDSHYNISYTFVRYAVTLGASPMVCRPIVLCLAISAAISPGPACAAATEAVDAHVTLVETTYVPSDVRFTIDKQYGKCPAGTYLFFQPRGSDDAAKIANGQAMLATLLTAKVTQGRIVVGGDDTNCIAGYIIFR